MSIKLAKHRTKQGRKSIHVKHWVQGLVKILLDRELLDIVTLHPLQKWRRSSELHQVEKLYVAQLENVSKDALDG